MYDLSKEFKIFYNNHVVLPGDKQQELRDKKDINIEDVFFAFYKDKNIFIIKNDDLLK